MSYEDCDISPKAFGILTERVDNIGNRLEHRDGLVHKRIDEFEKEVKEDNESRDITINNLGVDVEEVKRTRRDIKILGVALIAMGVFNNPIVIEYLRTFAK